MNVMRITMTKNIMHKH